MKHNSTFGIFFFLLDGGFRGFLTLIFRAISIFNLTALFGVSTQTRLSEERGIPKTHFNLAFSHTNKLSVSPLYSELRWTQWILTEMAGRPNSLRYMIQVSLSWASAHPVVIHVIFYAPSSIRSTYSEDAQLQYHHLMVVIVMEREIRLSKSVLTSQHKYSQLLALSNKDVYKGQHL